MLKCQGNLNKIVLEFIMVQSIKSRLCLNQFSNYFRKQMENQLKQVCLCIQQVAAIEDAISANRLSFPEVTAVMEMVDLKRRGYLDLNDIFELVGKVTETQLFAIFKHLDRSRTGEVRVADLQAALGNSQLTSSNTTKEYVFPRFYKMVDTIKDRPKITREAIKNHCLSSGGLKTAYQYLCELVQSKYLSQEELITVLKAQFIKNGLKWTIHCQNVIKELLPGQNVSEAKWIEAFTTKNGQEDYEEQFLLKGISDAPAPTTYEKNQSIYSRLKSVDCSSKNTDKLANYSRKINNFLDTSDIKNTALNSEAKNSHYLQIKTPTFNEPIERNFYNNDNSQYKTNFDQIQNNISSVLDNIQQRRDKLRQDSLERKKLIEDVMNRKKQLVGTSDWSENITKDWGERQQTKNSNVKKIPKSYLNYNPTFYQTQQPSRHREDFNQSIRKQEVPYNESSLSTFERSCGHLKVVPPPTFAAFEPKRMNETASSSEIAQILKKYTPSTPENRNEEASLKALCKSKSGFIYDTPSYQTRDSSGWKREEQYESYGLSRGGSSSKLRDNSYKENVMRKAEEEAAKKIEEIERKARMKVLEKKGRREDLEWNRLTKHGVNF